MIRISRLSTIFISLIYLVTSSFSMFLTALASEKVFDEALNAYTDATGFGRDNMLSESPLLGELARENEYEKKFRRQDGLGEIVCYPYPVHFLVNGKYEDIDNTLSLNKEKQIYVNKSSKYRLSFGTLLSGEEFLRYEIDENIYVSWSLNNAPDIERNTVKTMEK